MARDLGVTSLIIAGVLKLMGSRGSSLVICVTMFVGKKVSASVAQLLASREEEICHVYFVSVPLLMFICFLVDVCGLCLL